MYTSFFPRCRIAVALIAIACSGAAAQELPEAQPVLVDCNSNGIDDAVDLAGATSFDCNTTGLPDECEIASGSSPDCDGNQVPDECQPDCDTNGVADACDLASGAADCDANELLDKCEIAAGSAEDCNENAVPDACDIASRSSTDCNGNGRPDECETGLRDLERVFEQPPLFTNGVFADSDCQVCSPATQQSMAANFTLDQPRLLATVRIWGGYYPGDDTDLSDSFAVIFRSIRNGLPSRAVAVRLPDAQREQTGQSDLDGIEQWSYDLTLDPPVALGRGRWFMEVFDRTTDSEETFVWDAGELSSAGGIVGAAFSSTAPGRTWSAASDVELAFALEAGQPADCNTNGRLDECDLAAGSSRDCNANQVPDECEYDCDGNGVPDDCDIAAGSSTDCNGNGAPDQCDIADGIPDCDHNGVLDVCEIATGAAADCNANDRPDVCDITDGRSDDCQPNGIPDECETDSNGDGMPDDCPLPDSDGDGVPDSADACADTPQGSTVGADGCAISSPTRGGCGAGFPLFIGTLAPLFAFRRGGMGVHSAGFRPLGLWRR